MRVLGLHALNHDAGACLISPESLCAVSEERLSRFKHDGAFPVRSIRYVMSATCTQTLQEIDLAVIDHLGQTTNRTVESLRALGYTGEIELISHHAAHAASAFFHSPFERAAVCVVDACGSFLNELGPRQASADARTWEISRELQSFYAGAGAELKLIERTFSDPNRQFGIGMLYGLTSMFLGFGELGSGKVMALAARGGKHPLPLNGFLRREGLCTLGEGPYDPMNPAHLERYGARLFRRDRARHPHEPLRQVHAEIAHYTQEETQRAMLDLLRALAQSTGLDTLCLAGGFALNCPTNTRIIRETPFRRVFVQPAATDAGIPLGCALYGLHVVGGRPRAGEPMDVFLGRPYSKLEVVRALSLHPSLDVKGPEDVAAETARLIAEGKIVGWFEGSSEYGPRALGHRSILADPRTRVSKKRLDREIKRREWFRPYAPAALAERAPEYFDLDQPSPYMLLAPSVPESVRSRIPAVVHVDGTARVESVEPARLPRFHALIREFEALTGIPMVLNTSFNAAGEPIVETPEDAISCFLRTGLDALVLEDRLIRKGQGG